MYYTLFIIYIILSTVLGVWAFCWALKHGQFRDQERARFLPLREEEENQVVKAPKFHRYQAYGLIGFLIAGFLAIAALIIYALIRGR